MVSGSQSKEEKDYKWFHMQRVISNSKIKNDPKNND